LKTNPRLNFEQKKLEKIQFSSHQSFIFTLLLKYKSIYRIDYNFNLSLICVTIKQQSYLKNNTVLKK